MFRNIQEKFDDTRGCSEAVIPKGVQKPLIEEGLAIQRPKEKKAKRASNDLHRKPK